MIDLRYCCVHKNKNDKIYMAIMLDYENSPMHKSGLIEGLNQICSDCKNQSKA